MKTLHPVRNPLSRMGTIGRVAVVVSSAGLLVGAFSPQAGAAVASRPTSAHRAGAVSAFGHPRAGVRSSGRPSGQPVSDSPASNPVLHVNGTTGSDTGTCRLATNPCRSISYAVTQAPSAATISVAADTYPEQVTIPGGKNLNIVGSGTSNTIIQPATLPGSDPDTDGGPAIYAIVDAQPGSGVKLSKLTVDGTQATSSFNDCSKDFTGVYYHDASGSMTTVNVNGIQLPPADFGCQDGLGIYAASDPGTGSPSVVTMAKVVVTAYDKNGITCDDVGTQCTIKNSTVTGIGPTAAIAQNGIQGFLATKVIVSGTKVSGNTYTPQTVSATDMLFIDDATTGVTSSKATAGDVGIFVFFDGSDLGSDSTVITGNTANNATSSLGDGIDVEGSSTGGSTTVDLNTTNSNPEFGVGLFGATGTTVSRTTAKHNLDGIFVGTGFVNSTSNSVQNNTTSQNTNDGILADSSSSGNSFTSNAAASNPNFDYEDQSSGGGTAGTNNTWTSNTCLPAADSSPQGLC